MTQPTLRLFENQPYLNLETYRKNGQAMPTPVWFVENAGRLYVRTVKNSGKVKRIRNNPQVRVAPCKVQGELLGEWLPGRSQLVTDPAEEQQVNRLLSKKYGLQKRMFDVLGSLRGRQMDTLVIDLN